MLHFPGPTNRCPRPYRGWSYGGLNGAKVSPSTVIPDAEFCKEESSFDQDTTLPQPGDLEGLKDQGEQLTSETLTFAFVPFPAGRRCPVPNRPCDLPQVPLWGGVDEQLYILPGSFSASRIGPDDLTVPTGSAVVSGGTVSPLSQTTQIAESAGVSVVSISNSDGTTRGVVDYLDMNGDSFPDVVGDGAIQYTTSHGTLGSGIGCRAGTAVGTLRTSTTKALSIGAGGTVAEQGGIGKIYRGAVPFEVQRTDLEKLATPATQIMINLGNPELAFKTSFLPNDGVGLARMEFIISDAIKVHPMALVHPEKVGDPAERATIARLCHGYSTPADFFIERLSEGVGTIAAAFYPKPVIVRMSDFKSNEYAALVGGRWFEPAEQNTHDRLPRSLALCPSCVRGGFRP